MASDVRIYDGTNWQSLKGPAGPQGPEGPTVVSADAVNCAKLGSDGKILVAQADLDSRYVNVTGDTMTGPLAIQTASVAAGASLLSASTESGQAEIALTPTTAAGTQPRLSFLSRRGTAAAPAPLQNNDGLGIIAWRAAGTDGVVRGHTSISSVARSAQGANGYDTQFSFTAVASDSAKTNATFGLYNAAATGSYFYVTTDTFTVNSAGGVTTAAGVTVKSGNVQLANGSLAVIQGDIYTNDGSIAATKNSSGAGCQFTATGTLATSPSYGMIAKVSGAASDCAGVRVDATCSTVGSPVIGVQIVNTPKADKAYALFSSADADNYFKGNVGINWTTPTVPLEVGGAARIRSTLEVTGNITSTGTAHSFANGSIPASAISGLSTPPTASAVVGAALTATGAVGVSTSYARADHSHPFPTAANVGALPIGGGTLTGGLVAPALTLNTTRTPASQTATGTTGQIEWDSNYLYQCISPNQWRRIAWRNWAGDGANPNPSILAPSLSTAFPLPNGQTEAGRGCIVLNGVPPASGTILGAKVRWFNSGGGEGVEDPVLCKVNVVTGVVTASAVTYSQWAALTLLPDERHALVALGAFGNSLLTYSASVYYYSATENGVLSTWLGITAFTPPAVRAQSRYRTLTASYTLTKDDVDADFANTSTGSTAVTITLPNDSNIPVGTRHNIYDLSPTASTVLQAAAGVTLNWNATLTGGAAGAAGGAAAALTISGVYQKVTLVKTGATTWAAFA
jgi:hypothetical protein